LQDRRRLGLKHMREKYRGPCRSLKLRSHYRERLTVESSLDGVSGREVVKDDMPGSEEAQGSWHRKLPPVQELLTPPLRVCVPCNAFHNLLGTCNRATCAVVTIVCTVPLRPCHTGYPKSEILYLGQVLRWNKPILQGVSLFQTPDR